MSEKFIKDICKIQSEISSKTKNSINYIKYTHRLSKKILKLKRFMRTRTKEKSLNVVEALEKGYEIDITKTKLSKAIKNIS